MDGHFRLELIKKLYDRLFTSGTTVSKLRNATISGCLFPGSTDSINIVGRSIAWKLFLAKEEPLQASLPARASSLLENLSESRKRYDTLLEEKLRAPDGNPRSPQRRLQGGDLDLNNPLSLHDENPWNDWFAGLELRKVISQDVERTFPDIDFYRESEVQEQLTNILFLYSVMHPSIGYRQGMHELLAPLYYAVRYDAIDPNEIQDAQYQDLTELCSPEFTAADSWALFDTVMNGVHKWYEWRESDESPSSPLPNHVIVPEGQNGMVPYVAPIVRACNYIQSNLLRACDPVLFQSMQKAGIEPQIYGIRWLRLLFTREFSMLDALRLWDGLFACDPSLELAQWVCVAMLIRIRNELIPVDYSGQLTTLLRYPSPPMLPPIEGAPHHAILIIRQALALQVSPNSDTGATIVMENRTLLGIPVEVPSAAIPISPRRRSPGHGSTLSNQFNGSPGRHIKQQPSSSSVTISDFTRGLVERGESLGINKTLMNAVTELRRNIPELAASLGVKAGNQISAFPLVDERPIEERPPWEPQTRFEVEKELALFRSRDKTLGDTLAWVVDALLQDESGAKDEERMKLQKREALESLSYVRDVLMTGSIALDEDRLMGAEEHARRKLKADRERETRQAAAAAAHLSRPTPASVMESRPTHSASLARPRSPPVSSTSATRSSFRTPTKSKLDLSSERPQYQTQSSFTFPSSAISPGVIPRPPPPTSTTLRRGNKVDPRVLPKPKDYMDPLGALR